MNNTHNPPKLLDLVRARLRYKHMSYRTEQSYVQWIKRFILYHNKRHPIEMGKSLRTLDNQIHTDTVARHERSESRVYGICIFIR